MKASLLLLAVFLLVACDIETLTGSKAEPTPAPTPVPATPKPTPKPGDWMWKQYKNPLDQKK